MRAFILLLMLWSTAGLNFAYGQNCNYSVTVGNYVGQIQQNVQFAPHEFKISKSSNSANCETFRAYFGKGNANSYNRKVFSGNKTVDYNIFKESSLNNILRDFGDAAGNG